jgi:hypothetical protein
MKLGLNHVIDTYELQRMGEGPLEEPALPR